MQRIQKLPPDVVNRMAAGEVVVRPCNAIKELIENSLDAGAKTVTATLQGDKDSITIQVQDDGRGIAKEDLEIVAERFTTSKLKTFEDLQNMHTYGFRGEALASLSLVSKMTIISKTAEQQVAYQANYLDCKLNGEIKPSAGKNGTIVTAKDVFYNCPSRKKAFIGTDRFKDEVSRVMELVTKYAIQRPDVTFAFKTGNASSFRTAASGDSKTVIAVLLGKQFADNLLEISCESVILKYKLTGYISKPISSATARGIMDKKIRLINMCSNTRQRFFSLFVNGRAVECLQLKHAIDSAYSSRDSINTCTHLSLEIDPARVDVNVHPTKQSVIFLGMDDIIEELQYKVLEILNECQEGEQSVASLPSTTSSVSSPIVFYNSELSNSQILRQPTQSSSFISISKKSQSGDNETVRGNFIQQGTSTQKNVAAYFQKRTDSQERRLEEFFSISGGANEGVAAEEGNSANTSLVEFKTMQTQDVENTQYRKDASSIRTFKLASLDELKKRVTENTSQTLIGFFKNYIFVGFVNFEQSVLQYGTSLYLVNTNTVLEPFFYQTALSAFGNYGTYRIGEPGHVPVEGLLKATNDNMWKSLASIRNVEKLLSDNAEMLNNYFAIEFASDPQDGSLSLISIPCILPGLTPQLEKLPNFICSLAYVTYNDQTICFHEILSALASFYTPDAEFCDEEKLSALSPVEWRPMLRDKVLPLLKTRFKPPADFVEKQVIKRLVDAHDLYKVFERC